MKLKILDETYTIPMLGNKHLNPYGKVVYISAKGKTRTYYYELGVVKENLEVINVGSLYEPKLELHYYGGDQ